VFDVLDTRTAADALLWMANGRQALMVDALETAEAGNVEGATEEKSQEYAWEDVRRESAELPGKPDADALEALER